MESSTKQLWRKIKELQISPAGAELSFEQRLARENGWSDAYTQRVMLEYRRFLMLCAIARHPVTPSDQVDQAWHLHLVYTHSYWDDLCRDILGFQLHHGPTAGGEEEGARYQGQYLATLVSYQQTFNEAPPEDIWPTVENRFKELNFKRVNIGRYWLFPKFRLKPYRYPFLFLCLGFVIVGFGTYSDNDDIRYSGWMAVALSFFVLFIILCVMLGSGKSKGSDHGCSGGGCGTSSSYGTDGGCSSGCGGGCGGD